MIELINTENLQACHPNIIALIPRYVLKLVIVVLTGIGLSTEKDDVIFALSMATSFGALIYFGLQESILIRDESKAKPEHLEKKRA